MSQARDSEVIRARLLQRLKELAEEFDAESVAGPIEHQLGEQHDEAYKQALKTLNYSRYFRLLDGLEGIVDDPPVTSRAERSAKLETARLINKAAARLEDTEGAAKRAEVGPEGEAALHEVRNAAKQLMHAAESARSVHPKRAARMFRAAHRITSSLGDWHDCLMSCQFLESLERNTNLPSENRRIYRLIREVEAEHSRDALKKYAKARRMLAGIRMNR